VATVPLFADEVAVVGPSLVLKFVTPNEVGVDEILLGNEAGMLYAKGA
jgi:hypothetical protein